MALVDQESNTEKESVVESSPVPRLSWDASVGAIPLGQGWDAEAVVVDWSGEGTADLLVTSGGGEHGRIARLYRPLTLSESAPRCCYDAGTPVEALDGLRCLCPIPNGATSRFDLVALGREGLVFLRNQGEANRPAFGDRRSLGTPADLGIGPCRVVQIVAVDWDGDGLTDLLAGVDDLNGYWPEDDQVPPSQQVGFNQKGGHPGYDRQGLWRGRTPHGRLFWFRNVGRPGAPEFALQPEITGEVGAFDVALHPAPLAIAWGACGSLELLITDRRGLVRVYRNFGGQRPPVLMEPRTLQCGHAPLGLPDDRTVVVAGDIDGDRRAELLYGTSDGRIFAVHAGPTRSEAKTPAAVLHEGAEVWLGGHAVVSVGDLDGDGDLDLVFGDAPGRLHLLYDQGGGADHRYMLPLTLEAGGGPFRVDPGPDGMRDGPISARLGYACPTLADWVGHDRLDLIVGGAGGEVLFLRNDGAANSPRFGVPVALRCDGGPLITPPRVRPAAVDWNGTGKLDLVALNLQGFLCVYPRAGTLDLGPPIPLVDRLGRYLRLDGGFGQAGRCAALGRPLDASGPD